MGEVILAESNKLKTSPQVADRVHNSRPTLEDQIFEELFGGFSSEDEEDDEVESKGIDQMVYRRAQILGWTKGYRLQREFERMRINKETW
jgi:hypothetical protein